VLLLVVVLLGGADVGAGDVARFVQVLRVCVEGMLMLIFLVLFVPRL